MTGRLAASRRLASQTATLLERLVVGLLIFRAAGPIPNLLSQWINPHDRDIAGMPATMWIVPVAVATTVAVAVALWHGPPSPHAVHRLMIVDIGVALCFVVLGAALIPEETFFWPGRDAFFGYLAVTLGMWVILLGGRLLLLAPLLFASQFAGALVNGHGLGLQPSEIVAMVGRAVGASVGLAVAAVVGYVIRASAGEALLSSDRLGFDEGREDVSRFLHDAVLASLHEVRELSGSPQPGSETEQLARIRELATVRALQVKSVLRRTGDSSLGELHLGLYQLEERYPAIHVEVSVASDEPLLDPESRTALLEAANEALRNAARHALGSRVILYCDEDDGQCVVTVTDDGPGFEELSPTEGHGIRRSIRGRLAELGGSAILATSPGEGTRWELRVPLVNEAAKRPAWLHLAGAAALLGLVGTAVVFTAARGASRVDERLQGRPASMARAFDAGGGVGELGLPVGALVRDLGGCFQRLQGGRLERGAILASGCGDKAYVVTGAHWDRLASTGEPDTAALGYPKNDSHRWGRGWAQDFEEGSTGPAVVMLGDGRQMALVVSGQLLDEYRRLGGPDGALGYPTAEQARAGGTVVQEFERGRLVLADGARSASICPVREGHDCPTAAASG